MIIGLSGFAGVGKDTVADILVKNHGFVKMAIADPLKRYAKDMFDFSDAQLWGPSELRELPDSRYLREHTWKLTAERGTICACCRVKAAVDTTNMTIVDPPGGRCYLTPRYALQILGTEFGRHCYDSIWIERALRVARTVLQENAAYAPQVGPISTMNRTHYQPPPAQVRGVVFPDVRFLNELNGIKKFGEARDQELDGLIERWHDRQQVGPARGESLAHFLGMSEQEYKTFVETATHKLSCFVVRVTRPGFEQPRHAHQSETEQLSFDLSKLDYTFVGGDSLDGIEDKVAEMVTVLGRTKFWSSGKTREIVEAMAK